mgnify:CR=1 FL=1
MNHIPASKLASLIRLNRSSLPTSYIYPAFNSMAPCILSKETTMNSLSNEKNVHTYLKNNNYKYKKCNKVKYANFDNYDSWHLSGIPDGISYDNDIIEIKNRRKTISCIVPLDELAQIHAYMYIMKSNNTIFLQSVKTFNSKYCITRMDIHWDQKFWDLCKNLTNRYIYDQEKLCDLK